MLLVRACISSRLVTYKFTVLDCDSRLLDHDCAIASSETERELRGVPVAAAAVRITPPIERGILRSTSHVAHTIMAGAAKNKTAALAAVQQLRRR